MLRSKRLTVFAKGNVDVRDSLHASRIGGRIVWNGLNEIVRARVPGFTVRVRHETATGARALLDPGGAIPEDIATRSPLMGAYPAASQFSGAIYDGAADVIVLSVQADVTMTLHRHRPSGRLFLASDLEAWPQDDRDWLAGACEPAGRIEPADFAATARAVVDRIRGVTAAPILFYNLSSVVPGPLPHAYLGLEESLATRIRRFNLALVELAAQTGISVVDVDAVLAKAGADRLKVDAFHLTGEGYRLVADEVARILEDLGLFDD
jgi:hypothetical protein